MSRLWSVAIAFGVAACVQPGDGTDGSRLSEAHAAAIRDSVESALSRYSESVAARDYDALLDFYADDPDFVWVEDGEVKYRSRADIEEAFEGLRSMDMRSETAFVDRQVTALAPGLALFVSRIEQSFTQADGTSFEFPGALSATLVHGPNGWQFLNGHISAYRPREGG